MQPKAIIFGSIGTLAETSEMQRAAFNAAFEEAGLDWHWDREAYRAMLNRTGGRDRIALYAEQRNESVDGAALHSRKTEIFDEMMEHGLVLRTGVASVLDWADANGVPVAMASTTSRENLNALFAALGGIEERFAFVSDVATVKRPKPDPEVFTVVCERLGVEPSECVGIEDTGVNVAAPVEAGLRTIAFPGENAREQDYSRADVVVDELSVEAILSLRRRVRA